MLRMSGVGDFRNGTASGRRLGMAGCSDSIKGAFDYHLFVVSNLDRYIYSGFEYPAPGSVCTDVDVVK